MDIFIQCRMKAILENKKLTWKVQGKNNLDGLGKRNENPPKHFPGKTDQKDCQVVERAQKKIAGERLESWDTVNPSGSEADRFLLSVTQSFCSRTWSM